MTASKYPFPTVCAESQSRDWFHSISRTLKWNERERQKSFVVVEESPTRKSRASDTQGGPTPTAREHKGVAKENGDDEEEMDEEDEVSEEEDEKFDIDDLSSTETGSPTSDPTKLSPQEAEIGAQKVADGDSEQAQAESAARSLARGNPDLSATSHNSGLKSGVDTPDRFVGPPPHPPRVSPRHVQFASLSNSSSSSSIAADAQRGDQGSRDDIHGPRSAHFSTRVRIPRDRDVEAESLKTPTPVDGPSRHRSALRNRTRSRSRDRSHEAPRRAFAVWGQDESDSAASDSELDS